MKTFVSAKLHGIRVTDKSVEYHGSVSICPKLLAAAGIEQYEQVHVVNLNNGNRWVTYAIEGEIGAFTLNGGGARLGEIGDSCVVMTYDLLLPLPAPFRDAPLASVIFCDERNAIKAESVYLRHKAAAREAMLAQMCAEAQRFAKRGI